MTSIQLLTHPIALTVFCMLLLSASGCDSPRGANESGADINVIKTEIEKANQNFSNLLSRGDSVGLANLYTTDAKFMVPNIPAASGREEIQSVFSFFIKSGAIMLKLQTVDAWGTGDMITEEGEYLLSANDDTQLDKGKYIVVWKKEDGEWKLFRDIFNSDLPPPQ